MRGHQQIIIISNEVCCIALAYINSCQLNLATFEVLKSTS